MASIARLSAPARRTRRRIALLAAAAAVLLATLLTGPALDGRDSTPDAEAQARSVTVSPPNAKAGEFVTVRWSGFTPGSTVSVFQCKFGTEAPKWELCAEPTWNGGVTGADGSGQVQFLVWQFTLGGLGFNPAFACGAGDCRVVVSECDTDFRNGQFASTPITVDPGGENPVGGGEEGDGEPSGAVVQPTPTEPPAPTAPVTPRVSAADLRKLSVISGQAFGPALDPLATALEPKGIELDPTLKNSPSALDFFGAGSADVALTARPFSPAQIAGIESNGGKASDTVFIPVAISPMAMIHNMDVRGVPIQRFRMSVDTAAKLWSGQIIGVENTDFRADNDNCGISTSGRTSDRSMLGYYRTDRSAANYNLSNWLVTAGNDDEGKPLWPPAPLGSQPPPSPAEDFPAADESRGRSSNRELGEFVRDGSLPGAVPQITNDAGRLRTGVVDYSEVIDLEETTTPKPAPPRKVIRLVQVKNAAGNWVLPTTDAVTATINDSTIGADNQVQINTRTAAPGAYPIVQVYYAAVKRAPGGNFDEARAAAAKDFLTYLISGEGQALLAERGFVPISGKLAEIATKEVAALTTTTGATTTTAPPPTVPDTGDSGGGDFSSSDFDAAVSDFGSDFSGEDLSAEEDSFGGEEVAGEFSEDFSTEGGEIDGGSEESAAEESEEDGESVVSTPASVLGEAATAPALIALLAIGIAALVAGPALRVYGRRKAAKAVGSP